MNRLIIITGLSGSGKSVALHTLEDSGYYCIDNLPCDVIDDVLDKLFQDSSEQYQDLAIGIDMRGEKNNANGLINTLKQLRSRENLDLKVVFLDTDRSTLVTRYSETRRRHPLSTADVPLITAIDDEARLLEEVKAKSDIVIDTSSLTLHELRDIVRTAISNSDSQGLSLIFQSFGFKQGTPASTDFMFDVRCLPNPYWEPELRAYNGSEQPIIDFLDQQPAVAKMYEHICAFLEQWLPAFQDENRAYLTVSIGCTGGRHRSVYLTEKLSAHFSATGDTVSIRHRDLR